MTSRYPWSIVFVVAALLALAAVPIRMAQRSRAAEARVSQTLLDAREVATDLALTHARQAERLGEYLLTGSARAANRYDALTEYERRLTDSLQTLVDRLGGDLEVLAGEAANAAFTWKLAHSVALEGPQKRQTFLQSGAVENAELYDRVLQADALLRDGIATEVETARAAAQAAAEAIRRDQRNWTLGLVALALAASLAAARVAAQLRRLLAQAREGQRQANQARWQLDAVVEATAESILGLDMNGRVTSINEAGVALLGFTEPEATGRRFEEVIHAGTPGPASGNGSADGSVSLAASQLRRIREALDQGVSVIGAEGVVYPRRGGRVEVRWTLRPLTGRDEVRGAVLTLTDLGEVRAAERALRTAVTAREETMAVVGHDLRSPLGSILAASELLMEVPLPAQRRLRQLEMIQSAAERMNRIIQDLVDLSRIDSGRLDLHPRPEELDPILDAALQLVEPQAHQSGVRLVREWSADLPRVRADAHRILQALSNLLANALVYSPRGGRVTLGAGERGSFVEVWVEDEGKGIPRENLPHLWEPFWRPEEASGKGAGLGLAIVKGVIDAHGGQVDVASREGKGSRFSFTLPKSDLPDRMPATRATPGAAGPGWS